jgi:hypothetical protein
LADQFTALEPLSETEDELAGLFVQVRRGDRDRDLLPEGFG